MQCWHVLGARHVGSAWAHEGRHLDVCSRICGDAVGLLMSALFRAYDACD